MITISKDTEQFVRHMEQHRDIIDDMDTKAWIENPFNICFVDDRGNYGLLNFVEQGIYDGHLFFVDKGRDAIKHAKKMLDYAFSIEGIEVMRGLVPLRYKAARWFNRQIGQKSFGTVFIDDEDCELFILTKKQHNKEKEDG